MTEHVKFANKKLSSEYREQRVAALQTGITPRSSNKSRHPNFKRIERLENLKCSSAIVYCRRIFPPAFYEAVKNIGVPIVTVTRNVISEQKQGMSSMPCFCSEITYNANVQRVAATTNARTKVAGDRGKVQGKFTDVGEKHTCQKKLYHKTAAKLVNESCYPSKR